MRRLTKLSSVFMPAVVLGLMTATFASGCASFKLEDPPPGFAEVSAWGDNARYKAGDDVGINITTFSNVRGGTLAFWAEDLIDKLGRRGYVLKKQSPVVSKNGVVGTRFDFRYVPPTSDNEEKFYSAVLFVSDEHRVVIQIAGEAALASAHDAQIANLTKQIKIRGCKVGHKTCKGPQPAALSTPGPAVIATGGEEESEEPEPEPEEAAPEPEPEPEPQPEPAKKPAKKAKAKSDST